MRGVSSTTDRSVGWMDTACLCSWRLTRPPRNKPTRTLTHLSTDWPLSDGLLALVLDGAPALTHLCVGEVELTSENESDGRRSWGVRKVEGAFTSLSQLQHLPSSTAGGLHVVIKDSRRPEYLSIRLIVHRHSTRTYTQLTV